MSGVVSKRLKFKGDKPKKKKRSYRESHGGDDLEALAAADPSGWMFPTELSEVTGPAYILLPTTPLTCLAWDASRQRVYAAAVDVPEAPEGANELSTSETLQVVEPSDVNHVWVISRLAGSDDVVSLRTSSGTFLTVSPSGVLSATAASRGPLEALVPVLTDASGLFPKIALRTHADKYISVPSFTKEEIYAHKSELRGDADAPGEDEGFRIKCQREFVLKARVAAIEGKEGGAGKRRLLEGGPSAGSVEDELRKAKEYQGWKGHRTQLAPGDRREVKRAIKEGRVAEAMLDRRSKMKSDRYAK
ncbi:hypothetical protein Q8F55_000321 [Vanrija albida]|uniref:Protein FRG1 n=1 Tax=Vanrija albida TaxID=181172 RepID=A0ABR3QCY1_9TREE